MSPLSHRRTGVGNYVRGSLRGLVAAAAGRHEIVALAPTSVGGRREIVAALEGIDVELRLVPLPFAHAWRTVWSRLGRPALERLAGSFDVLHFSDWMYPPQAGGVRATTIHDLVPLRFPEWTTSRTRSMHGRKYENAARSCHVLFANSAYTARETQELLGVEPERTRVASPGVDPCFTAVGERAELDRPYVLTAATLEPRKNLDTLAAAHRLLGGGHLLAVAGGSGWGPEPSLAGPDVVRLGFVTDEELARLYRGAAAFVYPSRFEGFGMPVVEAMASECPCVVSSHPSLDEACGDAALRADPQSPEALAAAIERALAEPGELVARGREHARRFRWDETGRALLAGYAEASARA
ncbi:MAG: glycosyltransferase family 4 protein [Actinobacteria bacterium]|nr:glycosyltransferase family 4 protein [Actinomycetota bacterium]